MSPFREHRIHNTLACTYCSVCHLVDPVAGEPCEGTAPSYADLQQQLAERDLTIIELRWTSENPTKPGWYWWRGSNDSAPRVEHVLEKDLVSTPYGLRDSVRVQHDEGWDFIIGGEWMGPLEVPR